MCYLAQGQLHSSQEVVVLEVDRLVVDVVDGELELLHRLKVVVHLQTLAEGRAVAVLHPLCPPHLGDSRPRDASVTTFTYTYMTYMHKWSYINIHAYVDFHIISITVNKL